MRSKVLASASAGFVLWLAGCATVTFKRGASPDAMATDEQACRSATTGEAAYVDCMRERGWFITRTDEAPDRPAADLPIARPQAPADTSGVPATNAAVRAAPVAAAPPDVAVDVLPKAAAVPPQSAPTKAAANLETTPPEAVSASAEPLPRVDVASWWKLGGSAADLDRAIDSCVGELGAPHRPDPGAKVVTTAMRSCLRERGWYAFGGAAAQQP